MTLQNDKFWDRPTLNFHSADEIIIARIFLFSFFFSAGNRQWNVGEDLNYQGGQSPDTAVFEEYIIRFANKFKAYESFSKMINPGDRIEQFKRRRELLSRMTMVSNFNLKAAQQGASASIAFMSMAQANDSAHNRTVEYQKRNECRVPPCICKVFGSQARSGSQHRLQFPEMPQVGGALAS